MNSKINKLYYKINNSNKDVILFGLSYCEISKKTLELLIKNKISFKYYIIDKYLNDFFIILNKISKIYPNFNINLNKFEKNIPVIFFKKKYVENYINFRKIIDI